jgi:hypothetical protein
VYAVFLVLFHHVYIEDRNGGGIKICPYNKIVEELINEVVPLIKFALSREGEWKNGGIALHILNLRWRSESNFTPPPS